MASLYYCNSETIHRKPSGVVTFEEDYVIIGYLVLIASGRLL